MVALADEVVRRLRTELPHNLSYHDLSHTVDDVVPEALRLADAEGISGIDRVRLHAAALLHDIGYTRSTVDHELVGAALAMELLPAFGFDSADVAVIVGLILATRLGHLPVSLSEAVIADADLAVVGSEDFWRRHRALQREIASLGTPHEDLSWTELQSRFLRGHVFHTETARAKGEPGKRANLRRVATRIRRLERLEAAKRVRKR
ncbi:MAG: HD domain-containing protein [Trueperaceae bacterium]|nr:HD domain-containing protein [Trueperaceae bacterium]